MGGNINIKDIQENIYSQYDNAINLIKSSKLENKESDTELKLFEVCYVNITYYYISLINIIVT